MKLLEVFGSLTFSDAILMIIASTLITIVSTGILYYLKHGKEVSTRVLDEYLKVREQLTDHLADLASMPYEMIITDAELQSKAAVLSKLYYKYFDFLPHNVLENILCLITCLGDPHHRLYGQKEGAIQPLDSKERDALIFEIGLYRNFRGHTALVFKTGAPQQIAIAAIVCQARKVLLSIHQTFTMNHFITLVQRLKKPGRHT